MSVSFSGGGGGDSQTRIIKISVTYLVRYHNLIEIKVSVNNYRYYVIYGAKLELGNFCSLEDTTSQKYPSQEGSESSNSGIYPRKTGFIDFYVQNRSL